MKECKSIYIGQHEDGEEVGLQELDMHTHYENNCCTSTVCAQCGYRFYVGDDIVRVKQTGDVIHRDCFADYSVDSVSELCDVLYL